jgi:hypothetical protein
VHGAFRIDADGRLRDVPRAYFGSDISCSSEAIASTEMNRFSLTLIGMAGGLVAGVLASILRVPLTFQIGDIAVTPPIGLCAIGGIVGFTAGTFRSYRRRSG